MAMVPAAIGWATRAVTPWTGASAPEPADPGHLVPDDVWAQVVADATTRAAVLEAGHPEGLRALPDRTIAATSHGGTMARGPRLGVIHSMETPLAAGYAYAIARNVFGVPSAQTSATVCIDPGETIRCTPDNVVAYHCGPNGNGFTVGAEQAGRASFTRADWLTVAGRAQMLKLATYMVECRDRWGIPLRWATDAEMRAAAAGGTPVGWCEHDDVRRVLRGTSHTDPGSAYPRDELMALAVRLGNPPREDEDMTDEEKRMLREVHAQLCGPNMHRFQTVKDGRPVLTGANGEPTRFADAMDAVSLAAQVERAQATLDAIRAKLGA